MNVSAAIQYYNRSNEYPLCRLLNKYGSDKGSVYHHYSRFFHTLFESIQDESFSLLEIGLGPESPRSTSLYAWRDYFPNANIYGVDNEKRLLFQTEKIKTFYCDASKVEDIQALWSLDEFKNKEFRIIIDDGGHTVETIQPFFENSIHKLERGGVYIIEDLGTSGPTQGVPLTMVYQLAQRWKTMYSDLEINVINIQAVAHQPADNYLIVCQKL